MKKLLIAIAVIVVLVIAAAVVAPFFIPLDTYKTQLIARVKAATGRDLRIDGPVSFSLLPSIALEANKVSFSNAPGAGSPNMATLDKLQVKLKLLPLLHRDVEINQLVLVDPVITLEVDKQGRPNWQFGEATPRPAAASPATAPASSGQGGGSLSGLALDDVRLVNGTVSYVDQRSGEKQDLSQIDMKLSLRSLDNPLSAGGSAVWRNERMSLALSLANPRAFMGGKSSDASLKLASNPITFDFKGSAAGSTPAKLDGTVDLQVPSVRGLAAWVGSPIKMGGTGLGPMAISGKVSLAGGKIGFSDANLSLDAIKAKGEFAFDGTGARPSAKGRLDVDRLDLNPYLPPETKGQAAAAPAGNAGAPAAPASSGWSEEPIDLAPLKSADADFALTVGSLQYRKIQVGNSALTLHLKDGRLETDLTQLALYQGAGKGKVVLDGSGAMPAVEANFDLNNVQMEALLRDAMDLDRLSGTGTFDMAVTGRGHSQREIIGALNGKGDLNLANGAIKGMNIVGMVQNVASAFQGGSGNAQQTNFVSLIGTYTIVNGILTNKDLQLKSAELPVTGAGTVDLPRRTVDYKITPSVAGAVAIPVMIRGPWDNLSYQPDLAGMVGDPSKLLQGVDPSKLLQGGAGGAGNSTKSPSGNVDQLLKGFLGGGK